MPHLELARHKQSKPGFWVPQTTHLTPMLRTGTCLASNICLWFCLSKLKSWFCNPPSAQPKTALVFPLVPGTPHHLTLFSRVSNLCIGVQRPAALAHDVSQFSDTALIAITHKNTSSLGLGLLSGFKSINCFETKTVESHWYRKKRDYPTSL